MNSRISICLIISMMVLITACNHGGMQQKAYVMAKDFVKQQLQAPSQAQFGSDYSYTYRGNTYVITSEVEAENAMGGHSRHNWKVTLTYKGGEWTDKNNWSLDDIIIN